jgi:molybdenum cofactor guanylyltransferase
MVKRAALILAGGKARRFQSEGEDWQDKALVKLDGKPLLIHAIESVSYIVDEIVVCVNDEERREQYLKLLKDFREKNVKLVVDEKSHVSGPSLAIMSGLGAVTADCCLTLPCDMPFLNPQVAEYMFTVLEGFDVAVPMWPNGRLETLLMVLKRHNCLEIVSALCDLKRPRSDDIPRGANKTLLVSPVSEIKKLDPELKSFININSKEDLLRLHTRRSHGPVTQNLQLNLAAYSIADLGYLKNGARMLNDGKFSEAHSTFASCTSKFETKKAHFWTGVAAENQGEVLLKLSQHLTDAKKAIELDYEGKEAYVKAADSYRLEAEFYASQRCLLLAERASADKVWCESWAMGKHSHVHRYPPKVAKK